MHTQYINKLNENVKEQIDILDHKNQETSAVSWISGRALSQHAQGPGFDPQHCR